MWPNANHASLGIMLVAACIYGNYHFSPSISPSISPRQ